VTLLWLITFLIVVLMCSLELEAFHYNYTEYILKYTPHIKHDAYLYTCGWVF